MTTLLQEGKVDKKAIDEIAAIVAKFHSEAATNAEITDIGGIKAVKINWDENFAQTTKVPRPKHKQSRLRLHANQNQQLHD